MQGNGRMIRFKEMEFIPVYREFNIMVNGLKIKDLDLVF